MRVGYSASSSYLHCVADRINDSSKLMQHFDASDCKNGLQGRKGFSSLFFKVYFRGTTDCAESLTGVFHVSHPLKLRTTCCDSFYLFSLSYIVFSSLVYLILCSLVLHIFTLNICLEHVAMKLFFLSMSKLYCFIFRGQNVFYFLEPSRHHNLISVDSVNSIDQYV